MAGIALGALVVLNSVAAPIICGVGVVLVVALSCIKKVREVLSVRKIAVLFGIVFFVFGFLYVFLAALIHVGILVFLADLTIQRGIIVAQYGGNRGFVLVCHHKGL